MLLRFNHTPDSSPGGLQCKTAVASRTPDSTDHSTNEDVFFTTLQLLRCVLATIRLDTPSLSHC